MTKRFLPGTLNPLYEGESPYDVDIEELNNPYYARELEKKILEKELEQDLFVGLTSPKAVILGPAKFSFQNPGTDYAVPVNGTTAPKMYTWYYFRIPEIHSHLQDPCNPRLLANKSDVYKAMNDHPIAPFIPPDANVTIPQIAPGTVVEISYDRGPDVGMALFPKIVKVISPAHGLLNIDASCQSMLDAFSQAQGISTVGGTAGGSTISKCTGTPSIRTAPELSVGFGISSDKATMIVSAAQEIDPNMDPAWLANSISAESGFKTNNPNHKGSGANGLIQWMPWNAARALGYTKDGNNKEKSIYRDYSKATQDKAKVEIGTKSFKQQMALVVKYFKRKVPAGGYKNQQDVFMSVFYPVAMGKPDSFNIADHFESQGKSRSKFLTQNPGIVTKADYVNKALSRRKSLPC